MQSDKLRSEKPTSLDFDQLVNRCMGRVDLAQKILARFLEQAELDVTALVNAVGGRAYHDASKLAHRLKGSAKTVSAGSIAQITEQIESVAQDESETELLSLITELRTSFQEFRSATASLQKRS